MLLTAYTLPLNILQLIIHLKCTYFKWVNFKEFTQLKIMEENKPYYYFKQKNYETGLFQEVDATYIIHLLGNGRLSNIEQQLEKNHPTRIVYIVENQGYCQKSLPEHKPAYDLTDAFLQTFKHARKHHYNNILVLEDDFFFRSDIQKECHEIDEFLKTNSAFIYYLGVIPWIQTLGFSHNRLYLSTGMHACIYSKQLRDHVLEYKQSDIIDWDLFHNSMYSRYTFYRPLCYQLFTPTENSKQWYNPMRLGDVVKLVFSITGVNKKAEPGYTIHYIFSKFIFLCILLFCLKQFVRLGNRCIMRFSQCLF